MGTTTLQQQSGDFSYSISDLSFDRSDASIARRYIVTGYVVTALFLGSIFAWAAFVPISSAAIAPGVVGKEGYRKTVQHLEGGIIHSLLVKDGDAVNAGQPLIELANVQSRADFELLNKQKVIATAREATLLAAQLGSEEVTLPDWLDLNALEPSVREAIAGQIEASSIATRLHQDQLDIFGRQIDRARQKIAALNEERQVLQKSLELVQEELAQYLSLQEKGLVTRQTVFDLKRQVGDKEAAYSSTRVDLESTVQEINDLEMQKSRLIGSHLEGIGQELDDVRAQLVNIDEKLAKTEDTLERTIIRAPTDGVVVNLQVNTIGGVIASGQPLLDIVPSSGNLIVEARINPMDRDTVRIGQDAEVRFSAFNRRVTAPVQGRVALISADSLMDSVNNETYFQAKIELVENPEDILGGDSIYPGMQAEVFIVTGSRTALSYLVNPVVKSFNRAFRED